MYSYSKFGHNFSYIKLNLKLNFFIISFLPTNLLTYNILWVLTLLNFEGTKGKVIPFSARIFPLLPSTSLPLPKPPLCNNQQIFSLPHMWWFWWFEIHEGFYFTFLEFVKKFLLSKYNGILDRIPEEYTYFHFALLLLIILFFKW